MVQYRQSVRARKSVTIDFNIVTSAAESYCKEVARKPLQATGLREVMKVNKLSRSNKDMDDIHFKPFILKVEASLE